MFGAAIGDVVGSRFEFFNYLDKDFQLLEWDSNYTDDTICTVAVAEWALGGCQDDLVAIMRKWCWRYPNPKGAYGTMFNEWLYADDPQPYNSWGNGSAMRVSAVGWLFDNLPDVLKYAEQSAIITHNHPEGIKGAQATAAAIFWARMGQDKTFIRENITAQFGYDLSQTCDEIRETYSFDVSCQGSVPQAITAFLESENFEDAIRLAVSLGGDSDTLAAIAGSIAEAFYLGIPEHMLHPILCLLPDDIKEVLLQVKTF